MSLLRVRSRDEGPVTVVTLTGPLMSGGEVTSFAQTIQKHVDDGRTKIVLNVAEVTFMDSSGIGEVVHGMNIAKQGGGDLKLASLSDRVREVFKVTGLLKALDIHDTEAAAIADFG